MSDAEHHFLETSISAIQRQMEISAAAHKDSAAPFNDRVMQFERDVRQADIAHFRRCLAATKRTGANPSYYEYRLHRLGAKPELEDLLMKDEGDVEWFPI